MKSANRKGHGNKSPDDIRLGQELAHCRHCPFLAAQLAAVGMAAVAPSADIIDVSASSDSDGAPFFILMSD
jgi:hypothetical protein